MSVAQICMAVLCVLAVAGGLWLCWVCIKINKEEHWEKYK